MTMRSHWSDMRSPALAIAWEFGRRHRWGFAALAGYSLLLGMTDLLIVAGPAASMDPSWDLVEITPRFAAKVVVPVSIFTYYFLAVFSFGLTGDLAARQSMYPARLFTLPVTTDALAGWPMLYGAATLAGLFMAATRFAVWPSGVDIPLVWPALFVAATLAWTQALMWLSYGLPGLRVIVTVLWLATIDAVVFTALERKVSESVMIAALAPQVPLAYLCARFAVARARRGDVPDWRPAFARLARLAALLPQGRDRFPSAARAQSWFEWRVHGKSLPGWVGVLLPFELVFLFVAGNETPSLVAYTLCGVLLTPPLVAAFAAPRVRKSSPQLSDGYAITPFTATRPLTSAVLIAAKLQMAMWSTLATWLLVLVAIPSALTLSGTWTVVIERVRELSDAIGPPRTAVIGLLAVSGLVVWTWKQLVQSLYVGLSGREWLIRLSTGLTLTVLIFIEPIIAWVRASDAVRVAIWNAMPWILAGLVCAKVSAASWIATRLQSSRLLSDRTLVTGAASWVVVVLALYALFGWLVSGPLIPRYFLLLLAILAVPLARLSAAPLALAWNRHR
jgi:hypothetical protein